jgi:adenylosuccinate synthase
MSNLSAKSGADPKMENALFNDEVRETILQQARNDIAVIPIMGGAWGDEGKGKCVDILTQMATELNIVLVVRWCGTHNAGHTIIVGNRKIVTHLIPSGVVRGILSLIGPNCLLDPIKFEKELQELEAFGIPNVRQNIKVAGNVHIIKPEHVEEDIKSEIDATTTGTSIGTTRSGSGPCRAAKATRIGALWVKKYVETADPTNPYVRDGKLCGCEIVDSYEYIKQFKRGVIVAEGAQGYHLSVNSRDYPFVTSDDVTVGSLTSIGFPVPSLNHTVMVFKLYDTYVGDNPHFYEDDLCSVDYTIFDEFARIGNEYGATTGRLRKPNWLNLDRAIEAIDVNQSVHGTTIVINKCDVFEQVCQLYEIFKVRFGGILHEFKSYDELMDFICSILNRYSFVKNIIQSRQPDRL